MQSDELGPELLQELSRMHLTVVLCRGFLVEVLVAAVPRLSPVDLLLLGGVPRLQSLLERTGEVVSGGCECLLGAQGAVVVVDGGQGVVLVSRKYRELVGRIPCCSTKESDQQYALDIHACKGGPAVPSSRRLTVIGQQEPGLMVGLVRPAPVLLRDTGICFTA